MQQHSRHDREWEHGPGRRPADEGIRHRLRALFSVTSEGDAAEALIGERGREIDEQTQRLRDTVESLERREEQAARLRSAVEEMLRRGSAELDEHDAELAALADELRAREERLRTQEQEVAERTRELGAVELRRAALERREKAAADREAALGEAAAELRRHERELRDAAAEHARTPRARPPGAAGASAPRHGPHRLFLVDAPYRVIDRDGPVPIVGATVEAEGGAWTVTRLGRSALPGDPRPCAYVEPLRTTAPRG